MTAYYNENDPGAAGWLRELIRAGLIAGGDVDERSIVDVQPEDLRGYDQCHFFAGIGGWSYALRLAGWPDDRPVWSGSCPCQPFSVAGSQRGSEDERHLWPSFFRLIRECRPGIVFGEQVAGAGGYAWWDHVAADLEGEGYAAAAADIGAHSVGAPHRRQRLYWVAHADNDGGMGDAGSAGREGCDGPDDMELHRGAESLRPTAASGASHWSDLVWLPCSDGKVRPSQPGIFPLAHGLPAGVVRSGDPILANETQEARVLRLRGYGNAIVGQLAAAFIAASA